MNMSNEAAWVVHMPHRNLPCTVLLSLFRYKNIIGLPGGKEEAMPANPILRDNPRWPILYKQWVAEKKPGNIIDPGGVMYRVIAATDEDVQFHPQEGGIDPMYSQRSTSTIIR